MGASVVHDKKQLRNAGIWIDWAVFLLNSLLLFTLSSPYEFHSRPYAPFVFLLMTMVYYVGLHLKRLPLSVRIHQRQNADDGPGCPSFFLLLMHFVAFTVIIAMSLSNSSELFELDWLATDESPAAFLIGIVTASVITVAAANAGSLPKGAQNKHYREAHLVNRERTANVLLTVSVSFFTYLFWTGLFSAVTVSLSLHELYRVTGTLVLTYVIMYLPFRYVYLLEDARQANVWWSLLIIILLTVVRSLIWVPAG